MTADSSTGASVWVRRMDLALLLFSGVSELALLLGGLDWRWGPAHIRMRDPLPILLPLFLFYLLRCALLEYPFPSVWKLNGESRWRIQIILFFLILPVVRYWNLLGIARENWIWGDDALAFYYPARIAQHHAGIFHSILSWNPYLYGGLPNLGNLSAPFLYPLNVLFSLLPYENGFMSFRAFAAQTIFHMSLAGVGVVFLARRIGLRRGGAMYAGLLMLLSGFFAGHKVHTPMIHACAWLPFLLIFWDRLLDTDFSSGPRQRAWRWNLVYAACLFGLILLSGSPPIAFLAAFLLLGWMFFCDRSISLSRSFLYLLFIGGVGFLLAGVAFAPFLRYMKHTSGLDPTFADIAGCSLPARYLLSVITPALPSLMVRDYREFCIYLGTFTPILIAAVCCIRLRGKIAGQRWLLVLSVLLMLGGASALWQALYAFCPPFRQFRAPAQFSLVWTLAGALLAGYGLEQLAEGKEEARRLLRWILAATAIALAALSLSAVTSYLFRNGKHVLDDVDQLSFIAVILGLNLLVLVLWSQRAIGPRAFVFLIAALAVLDLSGRSLNFDTKPGTQNPGAHLPKVFDWLEKKPRPFRISVNHHTPMNLGLIRPIETIDGYVVSPPKSTARILRNLSKDRALDLLGVRWVLAKGDQEAVGPIVHRGDGIALQKNMGALPRYWVVYRVVWASRRSLYQRIEQIDPEREGVIVNQDRPDIEPLLQGVKPPRLGSPRTKIKIVDYQPEQRIKLQVELPSTGVLIASEPDIPGWSAYVDGRQVKTFPIDGGLRGIVVPEGGRTVIYRYRPAGLLLGASMTGLGIIVLLLLVILDGVVSRRQR